MIPISFGEFCWQVNPERLALRYEQAAEERRTDRAFLESRGRRLRRVSGEGLFRESGEFAALEALFLEGKPRTLILPGIRPFQACFTELEQGYPGGRLLSYRFVFLEKEEEGRFRPKSVRVERDGESLWELSRRWDVPLEELAEKNRRLKEIGRLEKGEKIWL